jgi:acyl-CoA reductase-like NAD-dependent aldehyde dehydrogenase
MNIKRELIKIFGRDLLFCFICGSSLRKKFFSNSDIDIFCCVKKYSKRQEIKFRETYFLFHKKKKANPDIYYPGELMRLKELENKLLLTFRTKPSIIIKNKYVYDGLVWAGMIVDNKKKIFGNIPQNIIHFASLCIKKWNKKLFNEDSENTEILAKKVIWEDEIFMKSRIVLNRIIKNKKVITDLLLNIESYETIKDELFKSIDCLKNISVEKGYLNYTRVNYISAFFPVNLPLYSLIIFGFIPSLMCKRIFIRPPRVIAGIIKELKTILFDNDCSIHVVNDDRRSFIENYVKYTDVILFTGRYSNVLKIEKEFPDKLIIYNGAGINPIIVNRGADINLAVTKTIKARVFNSGQDCAGPDSILVHEEIYNNFIDLLIRKLKKIKIGNYKDKKVRIGRLLKPINLDLIEEIFKNNNVLFGGKIDKLNNIVYPTVISSPLNEYKNYLEFFAPVFWVSKFRNDRELKSYFETKEYGDFAMYISVFGDLPKFKITKSNILINKIVIEIERGNLEYGGYGDKANFISYKGKREIHPILISREISK